MWITSIPKRRQTLVFIDNAIMVDSDYAYNQKSRHLVTGLVAFVGNTPVIWLSKRQGNIAARTYATEFSGLRTAIDGVRILCYMLHCLGCNIPSIESYTSKIFNVNISVVLNL